ncbi:MAG: glycerate kinase [bacterium]
MKVLICPDSFKGTFSASEVSTLIAQGVTKTDPQIQTDVVPLADGGEGTLEALSSLVTLHYAEVSGPLGRDKKVSARFGIMTNEPANALIETSQVIGLNLIPEGKRNPLYTTTYGVGELIKAALEKKCRKIIIGIGGSSTNDAGIGMAQCLGVKFFNQHKQAIQLSKEKGYSGKSLAELYSLDCSALDTRIQSCEFLVASDVLNPLYGKNGAAQVYAEQKGASPSEVKLLDQGLRNFAKAVKRSLNKDIAALTGGGAAGGLGAGLNVFLGAEVISGIDFIMKSVKLKKHIIENDVIITGEGRIDSQTVKGKTLSGVLTMAEHYNKPVIIITGSLGRDFKKIKNKNISVIEDASRGAQKDLSYFKKHPELIREAASKAFTKWRDQR